MYSYTYDWPSSITINTTKYLFMANFCAQYFTHIKALLQNMMNCQTKCFKRKETKVRIEFQGNLTQKFQLPQLDVSSSFPFPEQVKTRIH